MLRSLRWYLRHPQVLRRAREISSRRVSESQAEHLLVLCYGNIYRSPFCAAALEKHLDDSRAVRSAGFHPRTGRSCEPEFVALADEFGLSLSGHSSCQVAESDLQWADLVVIMDRRNYSDLVTKLPSGVDKIVWLGAFCDEDGIEVLDPYGKNEREIRRIAESMAGAAERLAGLLSSG